MTNPGYHTGRWVKVPVFEGQTDDEFLQALKDMPNGWYAVWACRVCGLYGARKEAHVDDCTFLDSCKEHTAKTDLMTRRQGHHG